jgi:cytochrome P450
LLTSGSSLPPPNVTEQDPTKLAKLVKYSMRWLDYFADFLKYSPPYNNPILLLEGKTGKINNAMDFIGQFTRDRLAEIRKDPAGKQDLWLYKWAFTPSPEDGSLLDDKEIVAAAVDAYLGLNPSFGFLITNGMWLLAQNPSVADKAYAEISQVLGSSSRDITIADFHKLPYLLKVVKEIFRYYPAAGQVFPRIANKDDTLRDWKLPAGTTLMINPGSIHQDPRFWENPAEFNPDRFDKPIINDSWIPFGRGKKGCPGADLGTRIANTYIAYLIRNFKWTYEGKEAPVYRMLIAARTKDPLVFKLQRRNAKDEL